MRGWRGASIRRSWRRLPRPVDGHDVSRIPVRTQSGAATRRLDPLQKLAGFDVGELLYLLKMWSARNRVHPLVHTIRNVVPIDVVSLTDDAINAFATTVCRTASPAAILSYPSALERVARRMLETGSRPALGGHLGVTDLNNYASPIIRYDIGDLGRFAVAADGQVDDSALAGGGPAHGPDLRCRRHVSPFVFYKVHLEVPRDHPVPARPDRHHELRDTHQHAQSPRV